MINEYFKDNWLKILKFNSNINLVEEPKELREQVRIPLTPIEVDAFLLYHLFGLLYPLFVNDQQNILDIILSDFELDNIIFKIYLYETTKPGIHSTIKEIPKDSIVVKQDDLKDRKEFFNTLQVYVYKEYGIKISCVRIIRKRGLDLINSHCEKLNKISNLEFFISLLDILQLSLEKDLFSLFPEPNFLTFFKNCISFLNGIPISKVFVFFERLLPSFDLLLILNSTQLSIAINLKKENKNSHNSEIKINLALLESKRYNLNNKDQAVDFNLIQSDYNAEKVVKVSQNQILLFLSELFELGIPPDKEKLKLLFQKGLFGIRSYDLYWSMYPKPRINNTVIRFLIRLFGINLNLKKLSHWAIPDFLFDLGATYIGLNAKILLILTDRNKDNLKHISPKLILLKIENGTIKKLEYITNRELIDNLNHKSLETLKLLVSEQFGFINSVLMVDNQLIKRILNTFLVNFDKVSILSLLKMIKLLKNPRYFQLYPEIPFYTLLKKKRGISFLKNILSIFIDKQEF